MPKLTLKYFDRLHEKRLQTSAQYEAGYLVAQQFRGHFERMPLEGLVSARCAYMAEKSEYHAAFARVLMEIIRARIGEKETAA